MIGKSSCSSLASSAANRSNTSLTTCSARASGRSTLLMHTIGLRPIFSALPTTNLVCGSGPSAASTSTMAPSTIDRMRSTSPPKSAWPGVSTMLMRVPCQSTEVALARMVMPRSRSRSLESIDPLGHPLVFAEGAGLLQKAVDQRGLAVVDVGDDSDVAERHDSPKKGAGRPPRPRNRLPAAPCLLRRNIVSPAVNANGCGKPPKTGALSAALA